MQIMTVCQLRVLGFRPTAARLSAFLCGLLLATTPVAPSVLQDRAGKSSTSSLAQLLASSEEHHILSSVLRQAGLLELLRREADAAGLTLFAPTDEAFRRLFTELGRNVTDVLNPQKLQELLRYHAVTGQAIVGGSDGGETVLRDGMVLDTLAELQLGVDASEGVKLVHGDSRKAFVIVADVRATNGVLHVIDRVLIPPELDLLAQATALGLDHFLTAMDRSRLTNALRGKGPVTVFAPRNAAFQNAPSDFPVPMIDLLKYHIASGFLLSGSLASGDIVTSVSDLKIGVDRSSADMRLAHGAGGKATVVKADVMARNGVLHVIDVVMSPATMSLRQLIEGMPRFSFFSSLSQGIRLDAAPGSGDALLTVFAPRNAAFDTILADSRKLSALDLGKVAMQHVSVGTYLTGTLWDGIAIPVLDGNFIRFWIEEQPDAPGSVLHADDIRVPDIMATNGVLHDIRKVLVAGAPWKKR
mmetsp:Transcript_22565/g.57792  ORF Transcript_22565/g.57792 Transcript_22565/m.57792 type:complete len:472 (+) Transcript_22565:143-1558(+)